MIWGGVRREVKEDKGENPPAWWVGSRNQDALWQDGQGGPGREDRQDGVAHAPRALAPLCLLLFFLLG